MKVSAAAAAVGVALVLVSAASSSPGGVPSRPVCPGPSFGAALCDARVATDPSGNPNVSTNPVGYGPAEFRSGYGLPAAAKKPQVIGIVDAYDDPTIEADLAVYSSTFGLPACTSLNGCFRKVNQSGQPGPYPTKNQSWALEISLDVEVAHAVCPNCTILLVEADSSKTPDLMAAGDTAVALGADVVSNSWGDSEFAGQTALDFHFNHPGVPIVFSTGDSGYGVQWPASSPYVTAVGGTTLQLAPNGRRLSETAWAFGGSGCSAYEPKPAWQSDPGCARRTVADVAADADPGTGAAVYDTAKYLGLSGWLRVGGTSLSAPLVASIYALAGNADSIVYGSYPYGHANALFDVTSGSNGSCGGSYLCTSLPGYDGPTGLGSPNGIRGF